MNLQQQCNEKAGRGLGRATRGVAMIGVVAIAALATAACGGSDADDALQDASSTTALSYDRQDDVIGQGDGGETTAVGSADSPYDEPDVGSVLAEEGISEAAATEPLDQPEQADPGDDIVEAPQVAVPGGESALCATVQIGRDAISDGATELAESQQSLLIERVGLVADAELSGLLDGIDDSELVEVAVLTAALDRCQDLGFEP